jgi:hypothetical protein
LSTTPLVGENKLKKLNLVFILGIASLCCGQVNTGGGGGTPGSNCGDSSHALGWNGAFTCQAITGTSTAGGSTTQLQFNSAAALGGISQWTTNGTTTITGSATSVFDLHLAGVGGLVLPGALATGIVKVTTSTGAVSILTAPAGTIVGTSDAQALTNKDLTGAGNTFPTFNQNTSGTAASATNFSGSLAGDVTGTQGVTVVAKVNGNSVPSGAIADQALIGTAANTLGLTTLPNSTGGAAALTYVTSTHSFGTLSSILTGTLASTRMPFSNGTNSLTDSANLLYAAGSGFTQIQGGNNTDAYYMKRATDTSSTGYFLRFQDAAALTDLFKVDVSGNATATSYSTNNAAGNGGMLSLIQGTAPSAVANAVNFLAPSSVTTYTLTYPGTVGAGLWRNTSGGTVTFAELSGDCTTSGSNAVTCAKVNGVSFPTTGASFDALPVLTASNTIGYFQVNGGADCGDATHAMKYTQSTHLFGCQAITAAAPGAGGSNTQVQFNTANALAGSANLTWVSPVLTVGATGVTGQVSWAGLTSGTTALQASAVASGTLTLPAATDTLVGKATTDTLTNKTLTSPVLTTPNLGTPTALTLTSATGLPLGGLVAQANATLLSNVSGGSASPSANALPTTSNALIKTSNANGALAASLTTDDGTTSTYTGTGGTKSPAFTATGTTAGFADYPQGTTSAAVAPCNVATSICEQAPTAVTSYLVTKPGAAGTGVRIGVNASSVVTENFSSAFGAVSQTAKTSSIATATVCAATANTACGQAGQYRISFDVWGSGTACSSVTAGKVVFTLTWTDAGGSTHTAVPWPLYDFKSAAQNVTGTFSFNTALTTEGANGSMIISTNGTVIQYASTYTACTTGTGTYNVHITTEQLQ